MKYRITSTEPDLINHQLLIEAVLVSSADNKKEEATVDDGDNLIRFLDVLEVSHYGREIGNETDVTLQASIDALLVLD